MSDCNQSISTPLSSIAPAFCIHALFSASRSGVRPGSMSSAGRKVVSCSMMRWMVRSPTENLRPMAASCALRRRRQRDLHRRPLQHLLMEGIELRIGLAPAAIGKAEIGIAEHAGKRDLRDVERARQHVGLVLENCHAAPGPVPVI